MQAQANAQAQQAAAQTEMQKNQAIVESKSQLAQIEAQLEMQKMQAEGELKMALMQKEFEYNMQLRQVDSESLKRKDKEKEDRKDQRTRIQATQQSELIDQRKNEKPPKNFESAGNDIMGGGFGFGFWLGGKIGIRESGGYRNRLQTDQQPPDHPFPPITPGHRNSHTQSTTGHTITRDTVVSAMIPAAGWT